MTGILDKVRAQKIIKSNPPLTRKEQYDLYLQSPRWKQLTEECFKRDNYRCRLCDKDAQAAHHRNYPDVFGTETVDDLTSLCNHCHHNYHKPLSIEEAKKQLHEQVEEGITCPVCEQLAKRWLIKLHSGMAYWLLLLVKQYQEDGDWISVKELNHRAGMRGGDYAKLKHWGLIVQATNEDISKRASGFWRPTELGIEFVVNSRCLVPRAIWTYDGKLVSLTEEHTTIREALGDKFNYDELIKSI